MQTHCASQSAHAVQLSAGVQVSTGSGTGPGSWLLQALVQSSKPPPPQVQRAKHVVHPMQEFSGVQVAGGASVPHSSLHAPNFSPVQMHWWKQSAQALQPLALVQVTSGSGSGARQLRHEEVMAQVRTSAAARNACPDTPPCASITAAQAVRQPAPALPERSQRVRSMQLQIASQPLSSRQSTTESAQFSQTQPAQSSEVAAAAQLLRSSHSCWWTARQPAQLTPGRQPS